MESPITVLWGNIINTFENVDSSSLNLHQTAIKLGKVSEYINYDNGKEKLKTPFATLSEREINIQETYLSHLWAFIYSIFVIYEEAVQKPLINHAFDGNLDLSTPLLNRAWKLFVWSISLTEEYSDWDESLPNPRTHHDDAERNYTEKVNSLFQSAVAYLMFHEFAHLIQDHASFFLGIKKSNLNEKDLVDRIQIENEADQFAFNMLIKQHDYENERWVKGLPIIFVTCSALLIVPNVEGIEQQAHPDLDNRMLNLLQQLNLDSEEADFYCWYLCCFIITLFLLKHDKKLEPGNFDTAQDAFFYYLDKLDEFKTSNQI